MKSALLLAAASVLVLGGCSGMFAPDPSATPTVTHTFAKAQCEPSTAKFTWTAQPQNRFQAVSVHAQSYGAQDLGSVQDDSSPDLMITSDETSTVIDQMGQHLDTWIPAMLASLTDAGLAPALYGSMYSAVDTTEFMPPKPHTGKWVRVVVAPTRSFDFGVTCADSTTAGGTLSGPVPANIVEVTIHCDDRSHPKDSPQKAIARAACANT